MLILFAAGAILWAALGRLLHPAPLERLGAGVLVSLSASLVNLVTARVLLAEGDLSLAEIAAHLGFCDASHFSRVFSAHEGIPPKRFRASVRSL